MVQVGPSQPVASAISVRWPDFRLLLGHLGPLQSGVDKLGEGRTDKKYSHDQQEMLDRSGIDKRSDVILASHHRGVLSVFFNLRTFICVYQLLSNYKPIKFKKFIS